MVVWILPSITTLILWLLGYLLQAPLLAGILGGLKNFNQPEIVMKQEHTYPATALPVQETLKDKQARATLGGGPARIEKQHASGKLTARERIARSFGRLLSYPKEKIDKELKGN